MTIYFGSDWHLDHENVIEFSDRPFNNVTDMNEFFFAWLDKFLKPEDEVYLLGDICWRNEKEHLTRLRGKERNIHLIIGNHDHSETRKEKYWASVSYYKELTIDNNFVVLMHYPIEHWNKKNYGSYHFHGHTHNNISKNVKYIQNRIDVGYDKFKFPIVRFDDVLRQVQQDYINNSLL